MNDLVSHNVLNQNFWFTLLHDTVLNISEPKFWFSLLRDTGEPKILIHFITLYM